MLTERQTFKAAMLAACIDSGLDTAGSITAVQRLTEHVKQANGLSNIAAALGGAALGGLQSLSNSGTKMVSNLVGAASPAVVGGLVFGPPALGAAAGYAAGKLPGLEEDSVDEIKQRELIDEYRRFAERARYAKLMKDLRRVQQTKRRGRPLV